MQNAPYFYELRRERGERWREKGGERTKKQKTSNQTI
jgi:hypothetical protein